MGFKFNATTGLLDIVGLTKSEADNTYLRLDCTNDPLTGSLETNEDIKIQVDNKKLYFGSGDDVALQFNGSLFRMDTLGFPTYITDNTDTVTFHDGKGIQVNTTSSGNIAGDFFNGATNVLLVDSSGGQPIGAVITDSSTTVNIIDGTNAMTADGDIKINTDSRGLYFGAGDDIYHYWDGTGYKIDGVPVGTVADADKVYFEDTDDSDRIKTTTVSDLVTTGGDGVFLKLDTSNDPLTGNLEISKTTPTFKLNDSTNDSYAVWEKVDSLNKLTASNVVAVSGAAYALDCNANNSYASISDQNELDFGTGDFTVGGWFQFNNWLNGIYHAWQKKQATVNSFAGWWLGVRCTSTTNLAGIEPWISNVRLSTVGLQTITKDQWYFAAIRRSGTSYKVWLGNSSGTIGTTTGTNSTNMANGSPYYIGSHDGGLEHPAQRATVDMTFCYNKALSDSDVTDIYNGGSGRTINPSSTFPTSGTSMNQNLQGLWYPPSAGATITDRSDNGFDLTSTGTYAYVTGKVSPPGSNTEVDFYTHEDSDRSGDGKPTWGILTSNTCVNGADIRFDIGASTAWEIDSSGDLVTTTDNLYLQGDNLSLYLGAGDDVYTSYTGTLWTFTDSSNTMDLFGTQVMRVSDGSNNLDVIDGTSVLYADATNTGILGFRTTDATYTWRLADSSANSVGGTVTNGTDTLTFISSVTGYGFASDTSTSTQTSGYFNDGTANVYLGDNNSSSGFPASLALISSSASSYGIYSTVADGGIGAFFTDSVDEVTLCTGDVALKTKGGRIVTTTRLTGNTTLDSTYHNVFCDTDGGAFTVTLPAGLDGTYYRIHNTGSSGNDLTITPNGTEQIRGGGAGTSQTLSDGETLILVYETTEDWW